MPGIATSKNCAVPPSGTPTRPVHLNPSIATAIRLQFQILARHVSQCFSHNDLDVRQTRAIPAQYPRNTRATPETDPRNTRTKPAQRPSGRYFALSRSCRAV